MSTDINETRTDQDPEHEQSEQEWPSYEAAAAQQEATSENTESEGYESERAEGEQPAEPVEGTEPPESPEYGQAATGADEFPAFGEPVQSTTDEPDTEQSATVDEPVNQDADLPRNTDPAEDFAELDDSDDSENLDDSENPENSAATEGAAAESDGVALPENLGGRNLGAVSESLVGEEAQQEFLSRWTRIQISFLEDPAAAVESADVLVQEIGAAILSALEERGGELAANGRAATDTEQKRLALRQYRAYLGALLPQ